MTGRARRSPPRRVVVLGASLAGLFAAAACAGDGRVVTVLERDRLPVGPEPRPGVPQGRQPHVLIYRGLTALEELMPGLGSELAAAGAVEIDTGRLAWLGEVGWTLYGARQFHILSATRPLVEQVVLRRVRQLPGVVLVDGSRVTALRRGEGAAWEVGTADGAVHGADLVVDATGRGSRLPTWLLEAGVDPGSVSEVDAHTGYATREYAVPVGLVEPAGVVVQQTPQTCVGALALPVEDGRWLIGALGSGERRPPRDPKEFERFVRALPDPALAEVMDLSEPVSDVAVHRQTANRRHHYERVRSWPSGLLVLGDALCAFNPVYGQGVAVAACQALALSRALARGLRPGGERRLLREFGRLTALPWAIATGQDLRMPTTEGSPSLVGTVSGRWTDELTRLAAHGDADAAWALARVYHLMATPRALMHPRLVAAVVRARARGPGPANPRPPIVRQGIPQGSPT